MAITILCKACQDFCHTIENVFKTYDNASTQSRINVKHGEI